MAGEVTRRLRWPGIFEDFPKDLRLLGGAHMIRVEEGTEEGAYLVRAELPGIDPEKDVDISVADGTLTVHAERSEESSTPRRTEFHYGSFTRALQLPSGAREEEITASYEKGILTVTVPLTDGGTKPRKIDVAVGS